MARPTKYKPEYCEHIREYFESFQYDPNKRCPLFEMYAAEIGVNRSTLREWCKNNPEFSAAYSYAQAIQLNIMVNNGLNGDYNGGFTKFAMANMHGWRDKQEVDHQSSDGSMSPQKIEIVSVDK